MQTPRRITPSRRRIGFTRPCAVGLKLGQPAHDRNSTACFAPVNCPPLQSREFDAV
jgi:hypothetical protein